MKRFYHAIPLILLSLVIACGQKETETSADTFSDLPKAYNFELVTLEGEKITLKDYRGKALILDIWDTWCPPCIKGIPDFIELYSKYNDKGLEILGVAIGREGVDAVRDFVQQNRVNYTNALMTEDFIPGVGNIRGIPTTFVIDKNGRIYKKYVGYRAQSVFEQDIRKILEL